MLPFTYFTSIFLILAFEIYTVSSIPCNEITETSGTITNEKRASSYSKCWRIRVPQNSQALIEMKSFSAPYFLSECVDTEVTVSLDNEDESYVFCPNGIWESVIFNGDFTVTHRINFYDNLETSTFSLKYKIESLLCSYTCSDGVCILQSQVCDGTEDCSDGADEGECGNIALVHGLNASRTNAIQWLKSKWSHTTGWQENTHRGIAALFLAGDRNTRNIEHKLMVKQLEVQTLVYLLRKEMDPVTTNQLSMFVNALTVACLDPNNFYGHDLLKLLKDKVEVPYSISHPVAYLALCNAGATLPANATNDISVLLKTNTEYPFLIDVQAMAVMALSCLQANNQKDLNDSFPQTDYEEAVRKFKQLQLEDGSFGNIYTTAIVTQALLSAGQQDREGWHYNKAVNHLIHYLNSSSGDFLSVYLTLPVLNGKSLSHIRNTNCTLIKRSDPVSNVKSKLGPKMHVQYFLYIGDEKDIVHTISLRVPESITVFEVMQLAQEADSKYKFRAKQMIDNIYIYELAGITNDFEDGKFWLLYVGKDAESLRHTNKSPDLVITQDGSLIVMWYKKAHI